MSCFLLSFKESTSVALDTGAFSSSSGCFGFGSCWAFYSDDFDDILGGVLLVSSIRRFPSFLLGVSWLSGHRVSSYGCCVKSEWSADCFLTRANKTGKEGGDEVDLSLLYILVHHLTSWSSLSCPKPAISSPFHTPCLGRQPRGRGGGRSTVELGREVRTRPGLKIWGPGLGIKREGRRSRRSGEGLGSTAGEGGRSPLFFFFWLGRKGGR